MKWNWSCAIAVGAMVVLAGTLFPPSEVFAGATITIQNNDAAGEGFNDPTPWTPTGGNPATTLGQARLNAAQYAADQWAACLTSDVTIVIRAQMDPHDCDSTMAVLGWAGTTTIHRDFAGAPLPETWYSQSLANALAGVDLWPSAPDIDATFNSNLNGDTDCLQGVQWYYGYDGNPPGNDIDFVTVVIHEICHGLGFRSYVNLYSGEKFDGKNDAFMVYLDRFNANPSDYPSMTDLQRSSANGSDPNLRWTGAAVVGARSTIPITDGINNRYIRNHSPRNKEPGRSVSHWSSFVEPDELMEPSYAGPNHDPSLALFLLADIGWTLDPGCVPCMPDGTTFASGDTMTACRSSSLWGMRIGMTNTGPGGDAINFNATMTDTNSWLTITDPNCAYGDIAAGSTSNGAPDLFALDVTSWPGGSFDVDLDVTWQDRCGLDHHQSFTLTLRPPNASWSTAIVLSDTSTTVSRTGSEWILRFNVTDDGPAEAINFSATMTQTDTLLTITDPDCAYGDIAAGSTTDGAPDQFALDMTSWPGGSFNVNLDLTWEDACGNTYAASYVRLLDPPDPSLYSPVAFANVNAARVGESIEIRWNLAADEPIEGFNVYRQRDDQASEIRLNDEGPLARTQRSYADADAEPGVTYRYSVTAVMPDGTELRSPSVKASLDAYVTRLDQNHPNPFNPTTQIGYQVANDRQVTLKIYDVKGALVRELVDGVQSAGAYTVIWNGTNSAGQAVSTGVYFYRLTVGKFVQTRRMVLLK